MQNDGKPFSFILNGLPIMFSIISLIMSTYNIVKTHQDKRKNTIIEDISLLLSLFEKDLSNDSWNLLRNGNYINDDHQKLEMRLDNMLKNYGKDSILKSKIKELRTNKPLDKAKVNNLRNEIKNRLLSWRGR